MSAETKATEATAKLQDQFMTVEKLIQLLQKCNPKAIVVTNAMDGDMLKRFPIRAASVYNEVGFIDTSTGEHMYEDDEFEPQNDDVMTYVVNLIADS
jgi:hypothetical protein